MVSIDWVFDNVVAPVILAVIFYFSVRYMCQTWDNNRTTSLTALAAAALAWLISWSTWWRDLWSLLLFDNFFMTMGILATLSLLGYAALKRRSTRQNTEPTQ